MKNLIPKISVLTVALMLCSAFGLSSNVFADESSEQTELMRAATSISISPVSKVLQLEENTIYEDSFKVTNNGDSRMDFEVYAAPYSYTYSETDDEYKLGFSNENNYTQITRWITFKDSSGNYVAKPNFSAEPNSSVNIEYRISTPSSIPAGGQYAVLFAHTLSSTTTSSGIKTEASPGLVVYGRASGDTIVSGEISKMNISRTIEQDGESKTIINASAKVKNSGNVDFMAIGKLTVQGLFGQTYYESPDNRGRISVIPESELTVSEQWDDTPYFGIFRVTWSVTAAGQTEESSQLMLILPPPVLVTMILLLTIVIVWIIIIVRKRKERRSRFMV
ncbi:hypothetical protein IKE79_00210 [Candidatus Saccharibacteria bacterium]|nr:hypothetical protein [Candidatus Saccharibacteria bacterium]